MMRLATLFGIATLTACGPDLAVISQAGDEGFDTAEGRIVGGVDSSFYQYCGGSILSASWVITAAHCEVAVGDKVGAGHSRLTTMGRSARWPRRSPSPAT